MKRTTPLRSNAARRRKNHARAYGGEERIAFVKSLPCIVSDGHCAGPIDVMHTPGDGGVGRKASACFTVACCRRHHEASHRLGVLTFQDVYDVDLAALAAETEQRWIAFQEGR